MYSHCVFNEAPLVPLPAWFIVMTTLLLSITSIISLSLYTVFTLQILMNVLAAHMAVSIPVSTHQEVTGVLVGVDMYSAPMERLVMVSGCSAPFMYVHA